MSGYVILLLTVLFLCPYFRLFIKRIALIIAIKRVCNKRGFTFATTHKSWLFGNIKSGKCDFCVVTANKVFRVKLASSMSSMHFYCFKDKNVYLFKSLRWTLISHWASKTYKLKSKLPFDFNFGMREEWTGYEKADILLFYPTPGGVFVSEKVTEREIWNGDFMGEALFYTKKGFIELLTKCFLLDILDFLESKEGRQ